MGNHNDKGIHCNESSEVNFVKRNSTPEKKSTEYTSLFNCTEGNLNTENDVSKSSSGDDKTFLNSQQYDSREQQDSDKLSSDSPRSNISNDDEYNRSRLSYWGMIKGWYNDLVNAIIRPPRAEYDISYLGPNEFMVEGKKFVRLDLELVNKRGLKLACSHWKPRDESVRKRPCIVYLHGNASCRVEAIDCLPLVLASGITLFSLDFAGSGISEGEYISLGWWEREDVETVVEYLRSSEVVSTIGLWGRSMGAVTALMFADRDPSIACMILDSPFTSLRQVARELVDNAQLNVPRFAVGIALKIVRASVKNRADFDLNKLMPISTVQNCFVPALFGAAKGDEFIRAHHSQELYELYGGDKHIVFFEGDHNTSRPPFFSATVSSWLLNAMVVPASQESCGEVPTSEDNRLETIDYVEEFLPSYYIPSSLVPSSCTVGYTGNTHSTTLKEVLQQNDEGGQD